MDAAATKTKPNRFTSLVPSPKYTECTDHSCELSLGMADSKKPVVEGASSILDEEDEATLAAIDRGIKAADEGRVVPAEEVRQRMQQWLTN